MSLPFSVLKLLRMLIVCAQRESCPVRYVGQENVTRLGNIDDIDFQEPAQITWTNDGTAPYFLTIIPGVFHSTLLIVTWAYIFFSVVWRIRWSG